MDSILPLIMKIISVVFLIIFILSVTFLIFTFRKPKKVSIFSLVIAMLISLITLTVFSLFINYRPSLLLLAAMGLAGLCIGVIWSQSTRVYVENGKVMSRNSIWYLVVWGGVFALTQLISIVTQRPPSIIMALLVMSTGSIIGMNGRIMGKFLSARSALDAPASTIHQCRHCGAGVGHEAVFCARCGKKLS
ncbi:MAG: zinc ribbon domain-containing protein [Smithella sp.]|nr:zinc ribbon domain-containing protein [Smithella sp.]